MKEKELIDRYNQLIQKSFDLSKQIIKDEECILQSEYLIEKSLVFDLHTLPNAKDNAPERRIAKNDTERSMIKKELLLKDAHQDCRLTLESDKLLLSQTLMQIKLLEKEIAFALAMKKPLPADQQ